MKVFTYLRLSEVQGKGFFGGLFMLETFIPYFPILLIWNQTWRITKLSLHSLKGSKI